MASPWQCRGCELLSDCIFDIPITTSLPFSSKEIMLWIAFRLYLWHTYHNIAFKLSNHPFVVNCFQIVSLTYLSQQKWMHKWSWRSCELLSDCIFDIPITTAISWDIACIWLWIAFRLYLWHTYHNLISSSLLSTWVVNCFQIVSLTYLSQQSGAAIVMGSGCELLSDCIFDIPITTIGIRYYFR